MTSYQTILVDRTAEDTAVGIITLNRPTALNALNREMMLEVVQAATAFDADPDVRLHHHHWLPAGVRRRCRHQGNAAPAVPRRLRRRPVSGLGPVGGHPHPADRRRRRPCPWRGMRACDDLRHPVAADNAKFGQPEIRLGVIPGIGGSQRLTRAVGKAKAMDMCLTGRTIGAEEAERAGLVSRIVPVADLLTEVLATASTIAAFSAPVAMMAKESVNRAFETTLAEGIRFERRVFHATFALADQKEGMGAFLGKRDTQFTNS